MSFDHRAYPIVEWDKRHVANNWAKTWDRDAGGDKTFGTVMLSTTGNNPPTHTMCSTQADDEMNEGIQNAFANVPFAALYYAADGFDNEIEAAADMGLQVIY